MANWTVSHKARVTIREKNGYVGGTSYWGTAESIDIVFDQMDDEPFDCSDEDKIVFTCDVQHGHVTFYGGEALEKFKDAEKVADIKIGDCWYSLPTAQKKIVSADGSVTFDF